MNIKRLALATFLDIGFLVVLVGLLNQPLSLALASSNDSGKPDDAAAMNVYVGSSITTTGKPGSLDSRSSSSYKRREIGKSSSPVAVHSLATAGIANGNFENGRDGSWGEFSTHDWELVINTTIITYAAPAHSGIWEAWLGGDDDDTSYITQNVVISPESPSLTYWQWIASGDVCGYDWAYVIVNNNTVFSYTLCSDADTYGWVTQTVDLSTYAGQTVQLQLRVETDSSSNSNLFIDDVAVGSASEQHLVYLPLCSKNYCSGPLFFDDFTSPNSGWGAWETPDYKFGGLNGEFQIILKNTDSWFWDTPNLVLPSDYIIEVDARHATSNLGNYGLMFGVRYSGNDPSELYQFIVAPSYQEYFLEKYNNDTWTTLIDWTYDGRINSGMATNHLMVERVGTSITVGVNSYWLETVYDGDFTSAGRDGGLKVFSYAYAPTDMRFDNFRVSCPTP